MKNKHLLKFIKQAMFLLKYFKIRNKKHKLHA